MALIERHATSESMAVWGKVWTSDKVRSGLVWESRGRRIGQIGNLTDSIPSPPRN